MFAFFMIMIIGCVGLYRLVNDWNGERKRKNKAINEGCSFYTDRNNQFVDVKTDVPYRYDGATIHLVNGKWAYRDFVKEQAYTGKVIRNLTQEKRDETRKARAEAKAEAIKNGDQYYLYEKKSEWPGHCGRMFEMQLSDSHMEVPYVDYMWADVNTDTRYFVYRLMFDVNVLLNADTGKLEIIVDEDKYDDKKLAEIRYFMENKNKNYDSLYGWSFCSGYEWSKTIHV